jgi:hypothetical protein
MRPFEIINNFNRFKQMKAVRFIFLLYLFVSARNTLFAQKVVDSVILNRFPVKQGVIYLYEGPWKYLGAGDQQVTPILTQYDSVFHIENGEVVTVCRYTITDDSFGYAVIIRNNRDEYICYSNLESASVRKGERVGRGTLIGFAAKKEDKNCREVDFILLKNVNKLSFAKEMEYLRSAASCEITEGYTL